MENKVQIEPLADHPEAIPILREWFEQVWAPYYGSEGPGDADQDLRESCRRNQVPMAWVAFLNDEVCGTAALKRESVTTHPHLTPWLAALLVGAGFRRRGVGEQLIATVEEAARELGFACIYAGTGEGAATSELVLRRRGWEFVEKGPYFVSEVAIFQKVL